MTLFVTHYPQVPSLAQMYPGAKNVHMKTTIDLSPEAPRAHAARANAPAAATTTTPAAGIHYLHEVSTGPCDMKSGYGLAMAEQYGFPQAVMDDARALRNVVREKFPVLLQQQHSGAERSLAAINTLLQHLLLLRNSTLEPRAMQLYLQNLRERIPQHVAADMLTWLKGGPGEEAGEQTECQEQGKVTRV